MSPSSAGGAVVRKVKATRPEAGQIRPLLPFQAPWLRGPIEEKQQEASEVSPGREAGTQLVTPQELGCSDACFSAWALGPPVLANSLLWVAVHCGG